MAICYAFGRRPVRSLWAFLRSVFHHCPYCCFHCRALVQPSSRVWHVGDIVSAANMNIFIVDTLDSVVDRCGRVMLE